MMTQSPAAVPLAACFHQPDAPGLTVTCRSSGAAMQAVRIVSSGPSQRPTRPPEPEDSFLILLHLCPVPSHLHWEDEREIMVPACPSGGLFIAPLERRPSWMMMSAHDTLVLSLPRVALESFAQEHESRAIGALRCPGGEADAIALGLGASLLPALRPGGSPPLFAAHVVQAFVAHITQRYSEMRPAHHRRGGLTPRQERIAKDMLLASMRGEAASADIARAVGLSRAHFIGAFRHSVGETPHRWLTARKVDEAKRLLAETDLPLTDIALACGFGDQSHFTRVFSRHAGAPPGLWRRRRR